MGGGGSVAPGGEDNGNDYLRLKFFVALDILFEIVQDRLPARALHLIWIFIFRIKGFYNLHASWHFSKFHLHMPSIVYSHTQ